MPCGLISIRLIMDLRFLQAELDATFQVWNNHNIRKTRRGLPSGKPTIMFEVPSLYGTRSYLTEVVQNEIDAARQLCSFRQAMPCDNDVYELCCHVMSQNGLQYPRINVHNDNINVYLQLRHILRNMLNQ